MLVYDFEVFLFDWLVVVYDTATSHFTKIVNDKEKLTEFYTKHKNDMWVGFNNKRYDDLILKAILLGVNPYEVSKLIIEKGDLLSVYRRYDMNKHQLFSIDISQDAGRGSLKEFEAYMGMEIDETTVPFNIKRSLTDQEINETLFYCTHDVKATVKRFQHLAGTISDKMKLVKTFKLGASDFKKTNAQLVSKILKGTPMKGDDELTPYQLPSAIKVSNKRIVDFYCNSGTLDYTKELVEDVCEVPHIFRFGGLHAARKNYMYQGEMWQLDVSSYYPSLMIYWNILPRGIPDKQKTMFKQIYDDRLKLKKAGKKADAKVYKLVLNTTYGCMKSKYNGLYDPKNANNVCITGQLMLVDLLEKLEPYITLIQSNTDGILIIPHNKAKVLEIRKDWIQRTHMPLDIEKAKAIYQKDVNNYILVHDNGTIKVKGGMVQQAEIADESANDSRLTRAIIDDAVVNYFVNGVDPATTVNKCHDLMRFQIVSKTGSSYHRTVWFKDKRMVYVNKVNRVFASTNEHYGTLKKIKVLPNRVKMDAALGNSPEHCYLANDVSVDKLTEEAIELDRQYYIDQAIDRIKQFKGAK